MKTAIILYMPVIHKGYLKMLEKFGSDFIPLYVIGESIMNHLGEKYPEVINPIKRDARALSPSEIAASMFFLYPAATHVLEDSEISEIKQYERLIFAEDELGYAFVREYEIPSEKTEFKNWFLRWNMPASTTLTDIECDRTVTVDELKELGLFKYTRHAREESTKSPDWWRQVGSVLVRSDGAVLLTACNTHLPSVYEVYYAGDPRSNFNAGQSIEVSKAIHSEASIIAQAGKYGVRTQGCELYVTTFPCPACANLIALSGIKRVYFTDGYSLVGALDVLRAYNVEVVRVV